MSMNLLFTDTTALQEHSQCPLVEMDSTTSQLISWCGIMSMLHLSFKLMAKPSVPPGVKRTHQRSVMTFTHHAVQLLMLLKVNGKKVKL